MAQNSRGVAHLASNFGQACLRQAQAQNYLASGLRDLRSLAVMIAPCSTESHRAVLFLSHLQLTTALARQPPKYSSANEATLDVNGLSTHFPPQSRHSTAPYLRSCGPLADRLTSLLREVPATVDFHVCPRTRCVCYDDRHVII